MDPTKPILDLYGETSYTSQRVKPVKSPPSASRYNRPQQPPQPKQISYSELKEKYQQLYHAYTEKVERVTMYDEQCESLRVENSKLREQVYGLQEKNDQLNTTLLNKNVELEEAYRQLQDDIRRGNNRNNNKRDQALDRLEDGLREAIISNFDLLREAATSQLKHP